MMLSVCLPDYCRLVLSRVCAVVGRLGRRVRVGLDGVIDGVLVRE